MPTPLINRIGERHGMLVVIALEKLGALSYWRVRCDCGTEKRVPTSRVSRIKSCGCYRTTAAGRIRSSDGHAKHGHAGNYFAGVSPTYQSWLAMKKRCFYERHPAYANYGGRGITVCDRWRNSFETFLADMGERPEGTTLDRFPNPDGNYEPGNCRWATPLAQTRNGRGTKLTEAIVHEIHGRMDHGESASAVARRLGINAETVRNARAGRTWADLKEVA